MANKKEIKLPKIIDISDSIEHAYELPRFLKYIKDRKFTLYFDNGIQFTLTTNAKKNIEDIKNLKFNIYAPLQPKYSKDTINSLPMNLYSRRYHVNISQQNYIMVICGVMLVNPYHIYQKRRLYSLNVAKDISDISVNYFREKFLMVTSEKEKKEETLRELQLSKKYEEDKIKGIIDLTPFYLDYKEEEKFLVTTINKLKKNLIFYLTENIDENKAILNFLNAEEPLPANSINWENIPKTVFSPNTETYIMPHFPVISLYGINFVNALFSKESEVEFYNRMDLAHKPKSDDINPDDYPRILIKSPTQSSNNISDYTYLNSNRLTKKVYKQVLNKHYGVITPEPVKKRKRVKKLEAIVENNNEIKQ